MFLLHCFWAHRWALITAISYMGHMYTDTKYKHVYHHIHPFPLCPHVRSLMYDGYNDIHVGLVERDQIRVCLTPIFFLVVSGYLSSVNHPDVDTQQFSTTGRLFYLRSTLWALAIKSHFSYLCACASPATTLFTYCLCCVVLCPKVINSGCFWVDFHFSLCKLFGFEAWWGKVYANLPNSNTEVRIWYE